MGGFDWIIAAILLASVLVGILRGFIKESLSLISWILSIWLAVNFCVQAGDFIHQTISIPSPTFRRWVGFGAILIPGLFILSVISYIIIKIFVRDPIKGVDRILGIGFGGLRGAFIVVALLIVGRGFGLENTDWWQNSLHIPKFEPFVDAVYELIPNSGLVPDDDGTTTLDPAEEALKALQGAQDVLEESKE